jgi:ribosomal protein L37E
VGTLMTRCARNAYRVATRPSPRSCGFAHPRRFPERLVWHARREGRLRVLSQFSFEAS